MLSLLHFLSTMITIHGDTEGPQLQVHTLHCDNEGLVTTLQQLQEYTHIYPNVTITPEWDCLAQTLHTLKTLGNRQPGPSHIKGHQDNEMPYEELELPVQLNCGADHYASQYLMDSPNIHHQWAIVFPQAACILHLPQGTITHNFKIELRNTQNDIPFQAKLCKTNQWDNQDFKSIDWMAHVQALQQHERHRPTFVKYLHDLLPIGKRTHKYNPKYPLSCPSCQAPNKDIHHFLQCPAIHCLKWHTKCLNTLEKQLLELNTKKHVRLLFLNKLK